MRVDASARTHTARVGSQGGFYLGSIGGPAAILAAENIRKVECIALPALGMKAVWRIEVEDFPAYLLVDDEGERPLQSTGGRARRRTTMAAMAATTATTSAATTSHKPSRDRFQ